MGIGIKSETCGEMTKHAADGLDVYTILQCDGGKGVAEIVESDLRDTCSFKDSLQHVVDAVRGDGAAVGGWEYILVMGLGFLLL